MLSAHDILSSSGKYPDRLKAGLPCIGNAQQLADKVNGLLADLGYTKPLTISSGFRTQAANAKIAGSAKASLHMRGLACDLAGQELGLFIRQHASGAALLRKHGLFMEALESTPSWTHIDCGTRPDRPSREFKP